VGAEECEIKSRTDFEKDSDREARRRSDFEKDSDREARRRSDFEKNSDREARRRSGGWRESPQGQQLTSLGRSSSIYDSTVWVYFSKAL